MDDLQRSLIELQDLDTRIAEGQSKVNAFEPRLASVEAPVVELEREVEALRTQAQALDADARRLERAAEEKRERLRRYQEHLERVRNAREEAAARTELDLVRRAIDADESEALDKMELLKRTRLKLDDAEARLARAREEVEPRRQEIVAERDAALAELEIARDRRQNHALRVPQNYRNLYERVRGGKTRAVMVPMTATGACGHCFNTLPVQEQNTVRQGGTIHRCEACGVLLYAPD